MNERMKEVWLEISRMLGEPTRGELDVFLRTWQRASQATRKALAEQSAQQEPVALKPCWYESKEKTMCRKCGQIHAEAITTAAQQEQTDWEAVAADQAMTIALLKAELEEVAFTESGWVWDGDQWQRPPRTWIELDHDDIHALMNEFFYQGMQPSGVHFANFARAIEAKLKEKNT